MEFDCIEEEPRRFKGPLSNADPVSNAYAFNQLFALSLFGAEDGAAAGALSADDDLVSELLVEEDDDSDELPDDSLFEPPPFDA